MKCPLCERVEQTRQKNYPYLIHEFTNSFLMLGEHQFFPGYCVLVSKGHHKEMAHMTSPAREELFAEMMQASEAIEKAMQPTKLNLCSLGNVVPHLHWHFFPRFKDDEKFSEPPWLRMHLFEGAKISPTEALPIIQKIKQALG